jgi:hypothetical protein
LFLKVIIFLLIFEIEVGFLLKNMSSSFTNIIVVIIASKERVAHWQIESSTTFKLEINHHWQVFKLA